MVPVFEASIKMDQLGMVGSIGRGDRFDTVRRP